VRHHECAFDLADCGEIRSHRVPSYFDRVRPLQPVTSARSQRHGSGDRTDPNAAKQTRSALALGGGLADLEGDRRHQPFAARR
jgi:hypothetical protein